MTDNAWEPIILDDDIVPLDVTIIEERIIDNAFTNLTNEQTTMELTSLLYTIYKDTDLQRHVQTFQDLTTVYKPPDTTFPTILGVQYFPLANVKTVYYPSDKDREAFGSHMEVDMDQVSIEEQREFVEAVHRLSKSRDPYTRTHRQLLDTFRPFAPMQSPTVHKLNSVDALRYVDDNNRMIFRLMQGDSYTSEGVVTVPHGIHVSYIKSIDSFDLQRYKQALRKFSVGDACELHMNEWFVWMDEGTSVYDGVVASISEKGLNIIANGSHQLFIPYDDCGSAYIYPSGEHINTFEFKFCKSHVLQRPLHFLHVVTENDYRYITPQTPSEFLYTYKHLIRAPNPAEIMKVLNRVSLSSPAVRSVTSDIQPFLTQMMHNLVQHVSKPHISQNSRFQRPVRPHFPALLKHTQAVTPVKDLHLEGAFVDIDTFRYQLLHTNIYQEHSIALIILKEYLQKLSTSLKTYHKYILKQKNLNESIVSDAQTDTSSQQSNAPRKLVIAKVYHSLQDVYGDTGKAAFFDKELDPTPYHYARHFSDNKDDDEVVRAKVIHDMGLTNLRDIDHELDSIFEGKRRIRIGEHCLLDVPYGKFLYVRRKVEGKSTWIKVSQLPSTFCVDQPLTYNDLVKSKEHCVLDSYENVCKSLKQVISHHTIANARTELSIIDDIENFLNNLEAIQQEIETDIATNGELHLLGKSHESKRLAHNARVKSLMGYIQRFHTNIAELIDQDDGYYTQGVSDEEQTSYMATYEEHQHYDVLPREGEKISTADQKFINSIEPAIAEILKALGVFLGLVLQLDDIKGMLTMMPKLNITASEIQKDIQGKRAAFLKGAKARGLLAKPEMVPRVHQAMEEKMKQIETDLLKDMYADVIVKVIAVVNLHIMIKYPSLHIRDIYPSCVRAFAYSGYPLNHNTSKSLTVYLCCLAKSIFTENDPRFVTFVKQSDDSTLTLVKTAIDAIMYKSPYIEVLLRQKSAVLSKAPTRPLEGVSTPSINTTFPGFKPMFSREARIQNANTSTQAPSHQASSFISVMRSIVDETPPAKLSIAKVPLMFNACCEERITSSISFYSFFEAHPKGAALRKLRESLLAYHPVLRSRTRSIVYPPVKSDKKRNNLTAKDNKNIQFRFVKPLGTTNIQENTPTFHEALQTFMDINEVFRDDAVLRSMVQTFDDTISDAITEDIDVLVNFIRRNRDDYIARFMSDESLNMLSNVLVEVGDLSDMDMHSYRHVISRFTLHNLPMHFTHIMFGKLVGEQSEEMNDEEKLTYFINMRTQFTPFKSLLVDIISQGLKHIAVMDVPGHDLELILVHLRVMLHTLMMLVTAITDKTQNASDRGIVAALISFVLQRLLTAKSLSTVDISHLRSREEQLREKGKEDEMSLFKADDDERHEQMERRKLRLRDWHLIGGEEDDDTLINDEQEQDEYVSIHDKRNAPISVARNDREEAENYKMGDYRGENDDGDHEPFEDFPSHTIFESERDA